MTARPMTEGEMEKRLDTLLSDLGWAYIETGAGGGCERTSAEITRATKEIHDLLLSTSSAVRGMREALETIIFISTVPEDDDHRILFAATMHLSLAQIKRAALAALSLEGEDKQATRGDDAATAPTTTDTKDTTK